tara:strand:+ start:405 stop:734 length:330 start_codon:yes stop_codon:yes gene_type:complete
MESIMNSQAVQHFFQHWITYPEWMQKAVWIATWTLVCVCVLTWVYRWMYRYSAKRVILKEAGDNSNVYQVLIDNNEALRKFIVEQQKMHNEQMVMVLENKTQQLPENNE